MHGFIMHIFAIVLLPWQSRPPCFGLGLAQFLIRNCRPESHVVEQSVQDDHDVHAPFTEFEDRD